MILANYHTHTRYCDGNGTPQEIAEAALTKRFTHLGFSSHAPVPFQTDWTMPAGFLAAYLKDARRVQKEFRNRMQILVGLEVDYIPEMVSPTSPRTVSLGLDYTIGSVHFLGTLQDGLHWTVDGPPEELERGIAESFGGSVRKALERYFHLVSEMVLSHPPDIVGHLDLVKKNNQHDRFFSEEETWYRSLIGECLAAVASSSCLIEVNTGGMTRGFLKTPYPSEWVLRECLKRNIPIVLNSDSHHASHLDGGYREASAMLKRIGYREQTILTDEGRQTVELA